MLRINTYLYNKTQLSVYYFIATKKHFKNGVISGKMKI